MEDLTFDQAIDLADNNLTPSDVLDKISFSDDAYLRWLVARNINTSPETLIRLSKDVDEPVKLRVSENPNVPLEALIILSETEFCCIIQSILKNPILPAYLKNYLKARIYIEYEL